MKSGRQHEPEIADESAFPWPIIFIAGCHRSGTTWVRTLFGALPNTAFAGKQECDVYHTVLGPFAAGLSGDAAWFAVSKGYDRYVAHRNTTGIFGERDVFHGAIDRIRNEHASDSDLRQALHLIKALYFEYCRSRNLAQDTILIDKSPNHLLYAPLMLRQFGEAKLVEVVRDGRDVCVSGKQRFPGRGTTASHISSWLHFVAAGERVHAAPELKPRIHRVRYEDLKAAFTPTVKELLRFAEIETDEAGFARIAEQASLETMRKTHKWHVWRGEAGNWKRYLSQQESETCELLAGDVLRRLGYR